MKEEEDMSCQGTLGCSAGWCVECGVCRVFQGKAEDCSMRELFADHDPRGEEQAVIGVQELRLGKGGILWDSSRIRTWGAAGCVGTD